jgi:hypothetical protein
MWRKSRAAIGRPSLSARSVLEPAGSTSAAAEYHVRIVLNRLPGAESLSRSTVLTNSASPAWRCPFFPVDRWALLFERSPSSETNN